MHYGKRFPFVDLLIVTMITYGRLSLSGVVGDHPGETTIRKGRSMNIQLMNVAVDIIEQRLAPLANVLTRNNHITAMRDSFALAMPFVIVGSLFPFCFRPFPSTAPRVSARSICCCGLSCCRPFS